ncbi:Protein of unknown function [Pyronema omphalodes CBS 100304]|uniref:Uncharacterized protein n=1 Tax=Pyronema omphalodes (strain CBS 100304) TaxID=1076935 RepID=U4LJN1_PYROM|nr:Protein of unknown function [Pyronema omphalodes CBS 100304]
MDNIPKITGLDKDDQTKRGRSRSRTATSLRPTTGDPAYEPSPAQALYAQQPQISQFLMIPQGPLTAGALSSEHLEMDCIAKDDYQPHQLGSHFFALGARCRHCGKCVIPANTLLSMEVIREHLDSCAAIPNIIRNGKKFCWKIIGVLLSMQYCA